MQINKTQNAARNMFFGTVQKIVNIIMPFITRTAMIYTLGANYLGLNSLFTSILQVLNLAELGVGSAMIFSMYKPIAEDDRDTICALMRLYKIYYRVIGLVILAAGIAITPFVPMLIKKDIPNGINIYVLYLMNLGSTVLSYWLFAYKNCLLYAHQRNDVIDRTSTIVICVQQVLQLLILFVFKNYYFYLIIVLGAQVAKNLINAFIVSKMYPEYIPRGTLEKEKVRVINQRVKDLFTSKIGSVVINSADSIVISAFMGLTALAMYQNYYYIMNSVSTFVFVIFSACTAGIGNSLITNSLQKNYRDFKDLTFIIAWISGFCVCCFYSLNQPFMKIWVGEDMMYGMDVVVLFCIYFYLYILSGVFSTYKDAAGIWHEDRFRAIIGAAVNLVINIAFVRKFGIYAILMSTILSYIVVNIPWLIYNLFHVLFKLSPQKYVFRTVVYVGVTVIICMINGFLCECIPIGGIVGLLLRGLICLIIPNLLFFVVFHRTTEFKDCMVLVKRMIKKH